MALDATGVYPTDHECRWFLCDLREPDGVRFVHEARALLRERSDLVSVGPNHMIVLIFPGGPTSERAA